MTLTRDSVLHYWSSRYGINPRIGGRPVFTRNSAGLFTTQEGEVDTAIVNTPRQDWATLNLPNSLTERRKVLTLELARSNALVAPSAFGNAAWAKVTMTIATGLPDPGGGTSACTLTAAGANSEVNQILATGSSIVRANSAWIRRRTGTGTVNLLKPEGAYVAVALTSSWQRFVAVNAAASVNRSAAIQIVTNGDAIDVWLAQIDDGPFATSGILAGSGASRAADSLYWNFPPVPQAMIGYNRFVESGSISTPDARGFEIGANPSATARFLTRTVSVGSYDVFQQNGGVVTAAVPGTPVIGDTVEHVPILLSTGAVRLIQSINGAAVTDSGTSGALALAGAWSGTRLSLNGLDPTAIGCNQFAECKFVKYADVVASTAQGIMDELRAFELGPNSEVL